MRAYVAPRKKSKPNRINIFKTIDKIFEKINAARLTFGQVINFVVAKI